MHVLFWIITITNTHWYPAGHNTYGDRSYQTYQISSGSQSFTDKETCLKAIEQFKKNSLGYLRIWGCD